MISPILLLLTKYLYCCIRLLHDCIIVIIIDIYILISQLSKDEQKETIKGHHFGRFSVIYLSILVLEKPPFSIRNKI